jgi:hypothetical protein
LQAVSDFPAAIFAEELIKAYPDAMVILSVRDEDTWYKSMMSTLWHAYANHPPGGGNPAMRTLAEQYHKNMWANDFPVHGRLAYQKHNDLVRELGKGSRFLEYNVKESWGPLCRFLEKPVPDQPFPMKDDWLNYKAKHDNQ